MRLGSTWKTPVSALAGPEALLRQGVKAEAEAHTDGVLTICPNPHAAPGKGQMIHRFTAFKETCVITSQTLSCTEQVVQWPRTTKNTHVRE